MFTVAWIELLHRQLTTFGSRSPNSFLNFTCKSLILSTNLRNELTLSFGSLIFSIRSMRSVIWENFSTAENACRNNLDSIKFESDMEINAFLTVGRSASIFTRSEEWIEWPFSFEFRNIVSSLATLTEETWLFVFMWFVYTKFSCQHFRNLLRNKEKVFESIRIALASKTSYR